MATVEERLSGLEEQVKSVRECSVKGHDWKPGGYIQATSKTVTRGGGGCPPYSTSVPWLSAERVCQRCGAAEYGHFRVGWRASKKLWNFLKGK